jgi:hypothetical protein
MILLHMTVVYKQSLRDVSPHYAIKHPAVNQRTNNLLTEGLNQFLTDNVMK